MLYIGETGRKLRTRFGEHRRAVSANDANQPVARHFNSGRSNPTFVFIVLLAPCMLSHITPIFNPAYRI